MEMPDIMEIMNTPPRVEMEDSPAERMILSFETSDQLSDDVRLLASDRFMTNDKFITSREFRDFVFKTNGEEIQKKVLKVTSENKDQAISDFWDEVRVEMEEMSPKNSRGIVRKSVCSPLSGWDISSAITFDNIRRHKDADALLNDKQANDLYFGSDLIQTLMPWPCGPFP